MTRGSDSTISRVSPRPAGRPGGERRLRVVYPPELAAVIPLESDRLLLGREGDGPVRLKHGTVSRRHAEVDWDGAAASHRVRDLESHNGSWVDGTPVVGEHRPLADGAVLRLGDVLLVYEATRTAAVDAPQVSASAIPGDSYAARVVRGEVARAAPDPSPVLLVGETGTGKEAIAREIHRLSGRRGNLVAVNCAALARELVEAQLFGHVRGAFTGATDSQPGLFRAAHEGTLFLDEVGELPLDLQPKLLRAIQEREIQPVGAAKPAKVDVRIVAATNRDLAAEAESGAFRRDLYARLALWEIRVPPLRARRGDLLAWVKLLHETWSAERGGACAPLPFMPDAAETLLLAPWSENLRGLDRLVHVLGTQASGQPIPRDALPGWLLGGSSSPPEDVSTGGGSRRPTPKREELAEVLARHGGSVRATAKHYGRDRRQIYRWLETYGLKAKKEE